eukprot:448340-Hanusia_phi.AAC.1
MEVKTNLAVYDCLVWISEMSLQTFASKQDHSESNVDFRPDGIIARFCRTSKDFATSARNAMKEEGDRISLMESPER